MVSENGEHGRKVRALFWAACGGVDGRRKLEKEKMLPDLGFLAGNGTVLYNGRHAKRSINMRSDRKVVNQPCRYPSMFNDEDLEARLN
jgi:hypothetical protein